MDDMKARQAQLQEELETLNPGSQITVHIGHVPAWRYRLGQCIDGVSWGFGVSIGVIGGLAFVGWLYG